MAGTLIKKTETAGIGKYSYKYADLAQIHEYLEANGLRYWQYIDHCGDEDYIYTVPIIDGKEQPARRGCRVEQAALRGVDNPAQAQGAAITYARRYSLLMAFGLATDDDDAQSLSRPASVASQQNQAAHKPSRATAAASIKATKTQVETLQKLLTGDLIKSCLAHYNAARIEDLSVVQASQAIELVRAKKAKTNTDSKHES